jgi:hypothetical protein
MYIYLNRTRQFFLNKKGGAMTSTTSQVLLCSARGYMENTVLFLVYYQNCFNPLFFYSEEGIFFDKGGDAYFLFSCREEVRDCNNYIQCG